MTKTLRQTKESGLLTEINKIDQSGGYYWERVQKHGSQYPSFNWPSMEMYLNLVYTYEVVTSYTAHKTSPYGITKPGFSVLMTLSRSQPKGCKQNEISHLMLVNRANITGLVDSLVRLGLVERTNDPHDRRVKIVKILPKGEKLLRSLLPGYYKLIHEMCSIFTAKERKIFNELSMRLRNRTCEVKG